MMIRQRARLVKWLGRSFSLPWTRRARLLDGLTDTRARRGRRHAVASVLTMVLLALCMGKFSLARMEEACRDMSAVVKKMCGVVGRISDNTFGRILALVKWQELQVRLWWEVRGFRERKQLQHDCLPIPTLALDGKTVASGVRKMSRFARRQVHEDRDEKGEVTGRRTYYSLHVMRAVLTSCRQKLCVWQHPVRSRKNEVTGTKTMLRRLFKLDKGMHLFKLVTFDAGLMGYPLTRMICDAGRHWLSVLKENQPELLAAAQRWYRPMPNSIAEYTSGMVTDHKYRKVYRIWRTDHLAGWVTPQHTWSHLSQVWCVEVIRYVRGDKRRGRKSQLVEHDRTVRYCATSLPTGEFSAAQCLELVLSHWGIEDDCFNALDVMWEEDTHKHFTTGEATLNLSFLRMMAYNLLQMNRRRKEMAKTWDGKPVWQTWDDTFTRFLVAAYHYYPVRVVEEERMLPAIA